MAVRSKLGPAQPGGRGGRLAKVQSPLAACPEAPSSPSCAHVFKELKNPYFLGDEVGLTQSLGWVDAWTSRPSAYAVVARTTDDVVAAVNFARESNLRLVLKGGGHSYQGIQCRGFFADLDTVTLHGAFIGAGCEGQHRPDQAVPVEAGAIWGQVYDALATKGGATSSQGGGCMTVGVAAGDALFAAAHHWVVSLHVNKGLAGAPAETIDAARHTAMNPAVLDAFALIICAAEGPSAYPGILGHEPDLSTLANMQVQSTKP